MKLLLSKRLRENSRRQLYQIRKTKHDKKAYGIKAKAILDSGASFEQQILELEALNEEV